MPIPDFDANLVIPPHLGSPASPADLSPYRCTTLELCEKFSTTPDRCAILLGLLDFRQSLQSAGFLAGFQWLDGSFLEHVERREGRPPADLDIVTFYWWSTGENQNTEVLKRCPILRDRRAIKQSFKLDHFFVDIQCDPQLTVESTRYWAGLFSHRRDGVWKGMLRIELNTADVDDSARMILDRRHEK